VAGHVAMNKIAEDEIVDDLLGSIERIAEVAIVDHKWAFN
jgi:hypothetical protein